MKKIWIGVGGAILAIIIVTVSIVIFNKSGNENSGSKKANANKNNPDSIIEQYGDILVKGNYGDIIDIAYFPESVLITEEKLEEKKKQYFEEMRENNTNVISFDYVKSTEDDEKVSYKLTINGTETEYMDVKKPENKLLIDDLYEEQECKTWRDSKITYNGVEIPKEENNDNEQYDTYKFIALSGIDYELKIENDFYENQFGFSTPYRTLDNLKLYDGVWYGNPNDYKEEIKEQIFKALDERFGKMNTSAGYSYVTCAMDSGYGYWGNGIVKEQIKKDGIFCRVTLKQNQDSTFTITNVEEHVEDAGGGM